MIVLWMSVCVNLCVCWISLTFTLSFKILSWYPPAPQHGNTPVHEPIASSPPRCSWPWSLEPVSHRRFLSSARHPMPRSAGWTAWDAIHDHRATCLYGLSSAWPVSSPSWHWSQKRPVRRLALLLETRTGGTVLLLPALILKPFSCLSLPHQTATCLNLIVLLFKTHYILHRILITPLQKITSCLYLESSPTFVYKSWWSMSWTYLNLYLQTQTKTTVNWRW